MISEFDLIKDIRSKFSIKSDKVFGIGDDCAVVKVKKKYFLFTIDSMVEGVHFDIKLGMGWEEVGYKSVVRAISDISAMGGIPEYILVALSLKKGFKKQDFDSVFYGLKKAIKEYKVLLIGGDITTSKIFSITVSVIGSSIRKPVLRSGAKVGDDIYLSGYTGLASAGLKILKEKIDFPEKDFFVNALLKPTARINLGLELSKYATSMIDISDGLVGDLMHILEESRKGAILEKSLLPVHKAFKKTQFSEDEIENFILNGGDDYELLFTVNNKNYKRIMDISKKLSIKITKIGIVTEKGLYLKEENRLKPLKSYSYEHFKR